MKKGLARRGGSLKMLPTYAEKPKGTEKGTLLALDLGGTNFRVASLELKGRRKTGPIRSEKFLLQKKHTARTGEALFDFIAGSLKKFMAAHKMDLKGAHDVGFTFSFPMRKKKISEGVLVAWTKGFSASGVEGKNVVGLLNKALKRNGFPDTRVVAIVNDTVSTLVARSYEDRHCDVGVILGTGTNACYYEKKMTVNIEWGNFNKLTLTRYDRKLDGESRNPGEQLLEKTISGMYLGKLVGLILADFGYSARPGGFKTEYISEIESDKTKDKKLLKKICSMVSTRAARLAAAAMASVVTRMDPRLSRKHTIAIDGSLYEKHPGFRKRVKSTLKEIFGKKAVNIELKLTKDASAKGAAIIAATARRKPR
jgi:hexokinase